MGPEWCHKCQKAWCAVEVVEWGPKKGEATKIKNCQCPGLVDYEYYTYIYEDLGPFESYDEWSKNPTAWHMKRFGSKTFENIFDVIKPVPKERWDTWNFQYGEVANITAWRQWDAQNSNYY